MRLFLRLLLISSMTVLITNCAHSPKPDLCGILSPDRAVCNPTDPRKERYRLKTIDMIGYTCVSPEDLADIDAYIKQLKIQQN